MQLIYINKKRIQIEVNGIKITGTVKTIKEYFGIELIIRLSDGKDNDNE